MAGRAGAGRPGWSIDEGRESAGRTDPHQLVVHLLTATGPDAIARLRAELTARAWTEYRTWEPPGFVRFVTEEVRPLVP